MFKRKNTEENTAKAHYSARDISIISSSAKISGSINTDGSIRVDGKVEGSVLAEGNMILGNAGEIDGDVKGIVVNIGGKINGSVNASEKVVLESTSSVKGDITCKVLVIEPGAFFNGKSNMEEDSSKE